MTSQCLWCEKSVTDLTAHIRILHDRTVFQYRDEHEDADLRIAECVVCGDEFTRDNVSFDRETCSKACKLEYRSEQLVKAFSA